MQSPLRIWGFLCLLACGPLQAEEAESSPESSIVVLPAGARHEGDYFAFGSTIEISGSVTGDVYLMGSQIVVDGEIGGDVLALGGSVDISGTVAHNIRIVAGQATLSGQVGGNATLVAGNVQLVPSGSIQGNLVLTAGNVDLASSIGGDATMIASSLRISSMIKHSVQAFIGHMRLTSKAVIGGNLVYDSDKKASIEPLAQVHGEIIYHPSFIKEIFRGKLLHVLMIGSKIAGVLMNFLYTLVVGLIWLRLYPQNLERALSALSHKPWKALACGVMLIVLLPLASLIFLMSILGAPFALTLLALNVIGFYTAKVITIFWVSNRLFKKIGLRPNTVTTFCLGLICYFAVTAIPFFGPFLAFFAMLFGLGAVPLSKLHQRPASH